MNWNLSLIALAVFIFTSCQKPEPGSESDGYYFPSNTGQNWESVGPSSLNWDSQKLEDLRSFLKDSRTKAFLILVDGKLVVEDYYNGHSAYESWQWNSAGKTLVSSATGIAQEEGLLQITDRVNQYLGNGWTSAPQDKENLIQIRHLLTMTSGIDDEEGQLTIPSNLIYKADAGTRWAYHNIFQKLMDVVEEASSVTWDQYFKTKIADPIGMDGYWKHGIIFRIYHSTARSMARFGILIQNDGKWKGEQVIPSDFLGEAIKTSQAINPSYGYFWWLNGHSTYMLPGSQTVFPGPLLTNAPSDMYAAMGAEDNRLYLIPSRNMVIVRMGESGHPLTPSFAVSGYDNELWAKISALIN